MYNFTKEKYKQLFTEDPKTNFCIILISHFDKNGQPVSEELLAKSRDAIQKLMEASFVYNYSEVHSNELIYFLNYEERIFSIRAFVGSLKQILYSLYQEDIVFIYYTGAFNDEASLIKERDYLVDYKRYGLLLSSRRPIPTSFLHHCDNSPVALSSNISLMLSDNLESKNYQVVEETLRNTSHAFDTLAADNRPYSYNYLLQYIMEVFVGIKLFFLKHNMTYPLLNQTLADALHVHQGIPGVLMELADIVHQYADSFVEVPSTEKKRRYIMEIRQYIDKNISTADLANTAKHFAITPSYLCRIFKEDTGMTFTDYIKEKRFEKAIDMLQKEEKYKISEICETVGYKSQSYFQSIFKQKYGMTPDSFRKSYRISSRD